MQQPPAYSRWRRWRIVLWGVLGIVLIFALAWSYAKFQEHLEWNRIDEMLAEQDKKTPHCRWHEFLPKPLQPGEVNGAIRFIEVGKQLTEEMLTGSENTDEKDIDFPQLTKEYWTTLESNADRNRYRKIHQQCRHCEQFIEKLLTPQPGCPLLNPQRPSVESLLGGGSKDEPPLAPDEKYYNYVLRWLIISVLHHRNENNARQAILYWRAWYECSNNWFPGKFYFGWRGDFILRRALWKIFSQTEPDEASLAQLQSFIPRWRKSIYTLDDVKIDRSLCVQHTMECQGRALWKENLTRGYSSIPEWIPANWHEWIKKTGIGTPSVARINRAEIETQLKVFDALEERLLKSNSIEELLSPNYDFVEQLIDNLNPRFSDKYKWLAIGKAMRQLHEELLITEALIAAERYRLKRGDFPKQWSDIVPSLLTSIPESRGRPFLMKPVPEGLAIYQIGFTGKDLGGKVNRTYGPLENDVTDLDTDDGFMLYYPKYRRQPRPPVKPKAKTEDP